MLVNISKYNYGIRRETRHMQENQKEKQSIQFQKVIGKTAYDVTCYFSDDTDKESLQDKIKRMILKDIQSGDY